MIHLVTFTLNPPDVARQMKMFEELQTSAAWMHEINDTWLIDSAENKFQIWNRLSKHVLPGDRMLIIEITHQNVPWGLLTAQGWAWVNLHLAINSPSPYQNLPPNPST
mgnify:CR=1 FL=1